MILQTLSSIIRIAKSPLFIFLKTVNMCNVHAPFRNICSSISNYVRKFACPWYQQNNRLVEGVFFSFYEAVNKPHNELVAPLLIWLSNALYWANIEETPHLVRLTKNDHLKILDWNTIVLFCKQLLNSIPQIIHLL